MVTDEPHEPWLTLFGPPVAPPPGAGEPFWSVRAGPLPRKGDSVMAHCFKHGHGLVTGDELRASIDSYRHRGRKSRLPLKCERAANPS
jgi:hypothetical protein